MIGYIILGVAVLVFAGITIRAVRRAGPMPESMAVADEDWNLIFQEQTLYQRPTFKRLEGRD